MGWCNRCHSYSCHCENQCGCLDQVKGKCVFYRGSTTECLGILTGTDFDTIVRRLDEAICEIVPPSGYPTIIVQGTANQIAVTSSTVSNVTTYTVALDGTILSTISSIQTSVATLQDCCDASVKTITTDDPSTLDITDDGAGNYILNVVPPSGFVTFDGIIYNSLTSSGTSGAGGQQILKQFNNDYIASNNLSNEDQIRIQITGQTTANSGISDLVQIELFDPDSGIVVLNDTNGAWNAEGISTFVYNATLDVVDINTGSALWNSHMSVRSGTGFGVVAKDLSNSFTSTSVTYSNLTVRVRFNNLSNLGSSDNFVRKLTIEVRKKI